MLKLIFLLAAVAAGALFWISVVRAGNAPNIGDAAPGFSLLDQNGAVRNLRDFGGKWLVLYFYPKDDTPGCTQQACTFRDDLHQLTAMGAEVVGVSVDDSTSHAEFARKYHLPFPLLADTKGEVAERYGSIYNAGFFKLAKRNTFLINPQGKIARVYLKADTSRNSKEVIADLKMLTAGK
ncbi:MAG TPA: peroxiredoxin [Burkholderiales bacterium]|nr:peroxiredoxin [Burkholderiales bacterium]